MQQGPLSGKHSLEYKTKTITQANTHTKEGAK